MAGKKFTRARTVYRRARSGGSRARRMGSSFGGGTFGPIIQGAAAGLVASTLTGRVPYGNTLGVAAVGWFTKNSTLLTLAGMQAAALIPNPLAGGEAGAGYI